jgi:hypothetical protein
VYHRLEFVGRQQSQYDQIVAQPAAFRSLAFQSGIEIGARYQAATD